MTDFLYLLILTASMAIVILIELHKLSDKGDK